MYLNFVVSFVPLNEILLLELIQISKLSPEKFIEIYYKEIVPYYSFYEQGLITLESSNSKLMLNLLYVE